MSERNPYGEAFDASRHVEPEDEQATGPGKKDGTSDLDLPQPPDEPEGEVTHYKEPGGALACGTMPHGVLATLRRSGVTCPACIEARPSLESTPS